MTLSSFVPPFSNISLVRSRIVPDTSPNSPTCPGHPHFVHPGNVSSHSTPSGYTSRNVVSELHATVNICVNSFLRFPGIGSSGDKQQSSMIYRKTCNTKTLESADRLYNSSNTGNGSSQDESQVRFSTATNSSASLEITYEGGDLDPSNYTPHTMSTQGKHMEMRSIGGRGDFCTEMKDAVSDSQGFRVRICPPMELYLRFKNTDSEMSNRVRKRVPHGGKRNRELPTPRIITNLIETLHTQTQYQRMAPQIPKQSSEGRGGNVRTELGVAGCCL